MYKCSLIMAAGLGTRMKSKLPKVVHKVCGKEIVNYVIDTARSSEIEDINVIVGNGSEQVVKVTESKNVSYSFQEEQLGTGHAVMCAKEFLKDKDGIVVILTGDAPLLKKETLKSLIKNFEENKVHGVILTSILKDPCSYGRILKEGDSALKIVEYRDCSKEELEIKEINAGMYCFDIKSLLSALENIGNNNNQKEYYLTDVIEILNSQGKKVKTMVVDFEETLGINTRVDLSNIETILRERINKNHMLNGVTIIDKNSTYISEDVKIESDVTIYPGNIIEGNTTIKSGSVLLGNNRIVNSVIGENVNIENSVILESSIGNGTTVGPFAYIRPESVIGEKARIGDFVEIKKSKIGNGTKVSHLTYIGDAEVGEKCNFGCGTVVVNYDGKKKHKTVIGDSVFIGCNTNLVSPVEVESESYIAAGSTITKKVQRKSLAIARARQVDIPGWVDRKNNSK